MLAEFLTYEADAHVRRELLAAIGDLATGRRYLTFNTFNVLLDADTRVAIVEDELDVKRSETAPLDSFADTLRGPNA